MWSIHAKFAQTDHVDTNDVVVLDNRDVRGAVGKGAMSVEHCRTSQNLKANVAVAADDVATEELGRACLENIDALTIAFKTIAAVDALATINLHATSSLSDCGTGVVLDVEGAEIHPEGAAVDVDPITSIVQDADSFVRLGGHGGIGATRNAHAAALIVLDGTAPHDEGGGHLHVQAITGIALDRTVENRSVGTLV